MHTPTRDHDPGRRSALVAGAILALLVTAVPFARFVFGYLATLIHELGHTVAHWAFGRPSIPAFDFAHGGGVTLSDPRQPLLVAVLAAIVALACWKVRERPRLAAAVGVAGVMWALAMVTGIDDAIGLAAGHAAVLLIAGLFVYRAEAGVALKTPAERPAYAFAGIFLWLAEVRFAWTLATSHEARVEYELAKGGGAWMDLSRLADGFLGTTLATTAALYLVVALVVPALGFLARRATPAFVDAVVWLAEPSAPRTRAPAR